MLNEISQKGKDKYLMISLICGIKNKTKQNKTQAHEQREQKRLMIDWRRGLGWGQKG